MAGTVDLQLHRGGQVHDRSLSRHRETRVFEPVDCFSVCFFLTGSELDSLSLPLFTDDNTGWPQDEFVSPSPGHLTHFVVP